MPTSYCTDKKKPADFPRLFSSARQKCSFQLTSPSLFSWRMKCPHCFRWPSFLFVSLTPLPSAFSKILLHLYLTSPACLVSSKCSSSVVFLRIFWGAHLFLTPTSTASWRPLITSSSPNRGSFFFSCYQSPWPIFRILQIFIVPTYSTMGCLFSILLQVCFRPTPPLHKPTLISPITYVLLLYCLGTIHKASKSP